MRGDVEFTMAADFRPFDRALTSRIPFTRKVSNRIALEWQKGQGFAGKEAERRARQSSRAWGRAGKKIAGFGVTAGAGVAAGMLVAKNAIRAAAEDSPRLKRALEDITAAGHEFNATLGRDLAAALGLADWDDAIRKASRFRDAVAEALATPFESAGETRDRRGAQAAEQAMDRKIRGAEQFKRLDRELTKQQGSAFDTEESRRAAQRSAAAERYEATLKQIAAQKDLNNTQTEGLRARAAAIRDAELRTANKRTPGIAYNTEANQELGRAAITAQRRNAFRLSKSPENERRLRAAEAAQESDRVAARIQARTDLNEKQKIRHIREERERIQERYEVEIQLIDRAAKKEEQVAKRGARAQRDELRIENLRLRGKDAEAERESIRLNTARRIRDIEAETNTSAVSREERIAQLRENQSLALGRVGRKDKSYSIISAGVPLRQQLGKTNKVSSEETQKKIAGTLERIEEKLEPVVA